MEITATFGTADRAEWRFWLISNYRAADEIWFILPTMASGEASISYSEAVEEALCFGWIDGINKKLDDVHCARRFTPRRPGSTYSRLNIERLLLMDSKGMIMPEVRKVVEPIIYAPFVFPSDILGVLSQDAVVWENFNAFSEPYKRIRVAYIESARDRPDEFDKRLRNFVRMTAENRMISGYGGTDIYY